MTVSICGDNHSHHKSQIKACSLFRVEKMSGTDKGTSNMKDAEEYVESIMALERVFKVSTTVGNGRKRNRSTSGSDDEKSMCGSPGNPGRSDGLNSQESKNKSKKARRAIRGSRASEASSRVVVTEAEVHVNAVVSVEGLIKKLAAYVKSIFSDLSGRIDRLESGLEKKNLTKGSSNWGQRC